MHYYLVDDCIEIREVSKPNNGRDPFPIMLRKQQLSKSQNEKYTPQDLRIGSVISVLGRPFFIRDCDESTRQYYKTKFNLTDLQVAPVEFFNPDNEVHTIVQETAPYNGFGTIEDSMGSCKNLVLKPPKKDFIKMLENEHKILRFVARMESKHKEDNDRRFVISYRLADDMMTIYEPQQRNAGVMGGKFLERTRVLKPNQFKNNLSSVRPLGSTSTLEYYDIVDLYIGAKLEICKHQFVVVDCDEYVLNYMEAKSAQFPLSDKSKILSKISSIDLSRVYGVVKGLDKENSGVLDRRVFCAAVIDLFGGISMHEVITLCRKFESPVKSVHYKDLFESFK